jgi:phenylacetaldehyde dehydrogenase
MLEQKSNLVGYSDTTLDLLQEPGKLFIAGNWVDAGSTERLAVVNPATGEEATVIASATVEDVNDAVAAAKELAADEAWSRMAPEKREALINRLADAVEKNSHTLAELESLDVGMPLGVAQFIISLTVSSLRYMAGWPSKIEGRSIPVSYPMGGEHFACTVREPIGVVGAIIPWNVPFMIAIWKLAPILATGCTLVLKPSEEASQSVLMLGRLAQQVGIPDGVLNIVTGTGPIAGEALARHADVEKISFTGSTSTGRTVARIAADTTKRVSLELGGKSPQIVFANADLDVAIPSVANSIFLNSGQTCVAGSRLYVQRKVYDQVIERLAEHAANLSVGHPMDSNTHLGPVINARQKRRIETYLSEAREQGGVLHARSSADIPEDGFYVSPTVVEAQQDMTILKEEVFGPVIAAVPFDEQEEAIAMANENPYGLSAYVYSSDMSEALSTSTRLQAGRVLVNGAPPPYPSIPEGGRKASGYGRDQGPESLDGYLDTKAILITMS